MAFIAGWERADNRDGTLLGKDVEFGGPDEGGEPREVWRAVDTGWEAAKGSFRLTPTNRWNSPAHIHMFAFEMVECESACWRVGVAHEDFPVKDMWSWFKTMQMGEPPPWAVLMAGGKSELQVYPPTVIKGGETKFDLSFREPKAVKALAPKVVLDGAGRLRLRAGDVIGILCDLGARNGDCRVMFFVNGVLVHEPLHLFCHPGEKWVPYVCLGNSMVRVRLLNPAECKWDTAEEQARKKADIAWLKGAPVFDGSGWLSRQQGFTRSCAGSEAHRHLSLSHSLTLSLSLVLFLIK